MNMYIPYIIPLFKSFYIEKCKLNLKSVYVCLYVFLSTAQYIKLEYISNFNHKVNITIESTAKSISKLKSYRQSIISEAVTGKIDVREWEVPSKN